MTNLFAKRLCRTFMWNFGNLSHSVDLSLEPWSLYLWNLGTCKSGTFTWNLGKPEPLCGTGELLMMLKNKTICMCLFK